MYVLFKWLSFRISDISTWFLYVKMGPTECFRLENYCRKVVQCIKIRMGKSSK